jgi:hypothetical protein
MLSRRFAWVLRRVQERLPLAEGRVMTSTPLEPALGWPKCLPDRDLDLGVALKIALS